MESLYQAEEKRQEDLDTLIEATREKLEVSSVLTSLVQVLRAAQHPHHPNRKPTNSPEHGPLLHPGRSRA